MKIFRKITALGVSGCVCLLLLFLTGCVTRNLPTWIATGLTRSYRKPLDPPKPPDAQEFSWKNGPITLRGWRFPAQGKKRGTLIYLHGVADSRVAVIGIAQRFCPLGFEVLGYDSRAHGESTGDFCTFGYYEKEDLKILLDSLDDDAGPIILIGNSMGGVVSVMAAAETDQIDGIVSMDIFSDLRTVSRDRAPWFISDAVLKQALLEADEMGQFQVDEVAPVRAADNLTLPVLLIHGAEDRLSPPVHSRRVFDALDGPKELILIEGARHNESVTTPVTWIKVQEWIMQTFPEE